MRPYNEWLSPRAVTFTQEEAKDYEPIVVMADEKNGIKEIRGRESHGEM